MSNPHRILAPLIDDFVSKVLFEHEVDLYAGEVDHRMRDMDVREHILATFSPLILAKTVQRKERRRISKGQRLSTRRPYQATSNDKRPAVQARKTLFNLVPCENAFEQEFVDFCDLAADVAAFAKNAGPQKLMIDYMRSDGHRAFYVPDFVVRTQEGHCFLVEVKGRVDPQVPIKTLAAVEWCKAASKGKTKWRFLYIPYHLFQQSAAAELQELARACKPALKALLDEARTRQTQLPLDQASADTEADQRFKKVLQEAGLTSAPPVIEPIMRQAVALLDHAVRAKMPSLSHAFQPLLAPLDALAIRILEQYLKPRIPAKVDERDSYFHPYLENLHSKQRNLLAKNQRYLRDNLVHGRSIQKLGALLFCLDYAGRSDDTAGGVWQDVSRVFAGDRFQELYHSLKAVNDFRNTRIAHVETALADPEDAWQAIAEWFRCLARMSEIVAPAN